MKHIRQINSINTESYVIVISDDYDNLSLHPAILEHPELFEISETKIPKEITYLNYQNENTK